MDMLTGNDKDCKGCPGCYGCDGCEGGDLDLEYIAQVLIDAGLCDGGEEITIEIGPDEGDGDDDGEEWEEPDEDDPKTVAYTAAFKEIEAYLASAGLLKDGQAMILGINCDSVKD